jgi:AAA15 family ATPase/GTPase
MLINFKFKNFLSFADECSFTMLANKDNEHENDLIHLNNSRLSKVRLIYGANASGKSSFIKAIWFVSSFIANSNLLLNNTEINVVPFKFCDDCYNNPSEFSITFIKEGLKYNYSFSCTRYKVINEKLEIYYSTKATKIFERTNTNEYKFSRDKKILNELKEKNSDNKLFLVTSATWNYDKTKPVVDYLLYTISPIINLDAYNNINMNKIISNNELEEFKKFCLKILNDADISINDFSIKTIKIKDIKDDIDIISNIVRLITKDDEDSVTGIINNANVYEFSTYHDIICNLEKKRYSLSLAEESMGTNQIFKFAPILYYVLKEGKVLFIDEIDRSLHPLLVEKIINIFKNKDINVNNAQLIANTHDTNLLNLNILRRDDLWFTERNYETGKSEMYSLSDFSPRKKENIEKSYLLGRFGAIPFIKEI